MRRAARASVSIGIVAGLVLFFLPAAPARGELALPTYIVTYDAPPTAEDVEVLDGIALGVHAYTHLPMASVTIDPLDLPVLRMLPGVRGVYPNLVLEATLNRGTRTTNADDVWGYPSPDAGSGATGYTGAGIGIAIVDAGVDGTHPDLCAAPEFCRGTPVKTIQNVKIVGRQSVADPVVVLPNQVSTDSSSGHGSHVAGIAAGYGVAATTAPYKYRGVAPEAKIVGLGTGEVAEVDTVLAAFDWVLANHLTYNIKIVNNSWGPGAGHPFDPNEPVQRGISALYDAGMSVVFGAGNDGPRTDSLNAFSANPKAISAAAGSDTGHHALFSGRGVPGSDLWRPTVSAPGMFVASVRATTGFYAAVADTTGPDPRDPIIPPDTLWYAHASGTSMSAPHVSGIIALVQEAALRNLGRYLTPAEVKNLLQNTAVSRDPSRGPGGLPLYQHYTMGAGYADALAAVRAVEARTGLQPYDDGVAYATKAFTGTIGPAAFVPLQSFQTTIGVAAGAVALDVMSDWTVAANDVDIDLYDPSGVRVLTTVLRLETAEGPNQYSSAFTNVPNERLTVVAPAAGTWRAVIHGTLSATDTVEGIWSVAYPDAAAPPPAGSSAVTIARGAGPLVAGQTATLTALVSDATGAPAANAPVAWSSSGVGEIVYGETTTHADGRATASVRSASPGAQTITVTSGAAAASTTLEWIGVAIPQLVLPEPDPNTPGEASGGGHFNNPNKRSFGFGMEYRAGSAGPGGELSFDDKSGTKAHAQRVDSLRISGTTATITGPATVNGAAGYRYRLDVTDNGSPGKNNDRFALVLTSDADPAWRYETAGILGGGNIIVRAA